MQGTQMLPWCGLKTYLVEWCASLLSHVSEKLKAKSLMHKRLEWVFGLPMSVDDPQIMFALVPSASTQHHVQNPCYGDPHQNMWCNQSFWKVVALGKVGKHHHLISGSGETNRGSQWLSSLQNSKCTHPPYIDTHWRWWS